MNSILTLKYMELYQRRNLDYLHRNMIAAKRWIEPKNQEPPGRVRHRYCEQNNLSYSTDKWWKSGWGISTMWKGWVNPEGSSGLSGIIKTTVVIYNYTKDETWTTFIEILSWPDSIWNPNTNNILFHARGHAMLNKYPEYAITSSKCKQWNMYIFTL